MLARLRPHGLETVGLRETLHDLVNGWKLALRTDSMLPGHQWRRDRLPPDLNITVYRLIQECLTNARAALARSMIAIRLSLEEPSSRFAGSIPLLLDVTESEMAANGTAVGASGAGLLGMRERVRRMWRADGDFDPAGGLSLHAWMPVVAQSPELVDAVVHA